MVALMWVPEDGVTITLALAFLSLGIVVVLWPQKGAVYGDHVQAGSKGSASKADTKPNRDRSSLVERRSEKDIHQRATRLNDALGRPIPTRHGSRRY